VLQSHTPKTQHGSSRTPQTKQAGRDCGTSTAPVVRCGSTSSAVAGRSCVEACRRTTASSTFSHKWAEVVSDPDGEGGRSTRPPTSTGTRSADVCASTYRLNGVLVSSPWSQSMYAYAVPDQSLTRFQVTWSWRPDHLEWLGRVDRDGKRMAAGAAGGDGPDVRPGYLQLTQTR
jgi:hypothetical protein